MSVMSMMLCGASEAAGARANGSSLFYFECVSLVCCKLAALLMNLLDKLVFVSSHAQS